MAGKNINDDGADPDEVEFKPFEIWMTERAANALEAYKRNLARAEAGLGNDKDVMFWREESRSCAAEFAAECLRIVLKDDEAELHEDERIEQAQQFINQMTGAIPATSRATHDVALSAGTATPQL